MCGVPTEVAEMGIGKHLESTVLVGVTYSDSGRKAKHRSLELKDV